LRDFSPVFIKVSSRPAAIHGRVTGSGQDAAPGAPVYLEAFDQASGKRLIDLRVVRTDLRGQYRFRGLAPGVYRVLSTFEFDKPDSQTMDASGARSVTLSEGDDTAQDLELYVR
jgi:Carboxypeptidase regulatory-like domain